MYTTTTILLALLTFSLTTTAYPAKRDCSTQYPSALGFPINFNITPAQPAAVSFQVPSDAAGPCSLVVEFPAAYPVEFTGSHNPQVQVRALDGPAAGSVVGTTTFASDPNVDVSSTVNSFACREVMGFQLEIADWETGSVAFQEVEDTGLVLTYGC